MWQALRALALTAVPRGSVVPPNSPKLLREWLSKGTFQVPDTGKRHVSIECSDVDFGGVLLSEGALLLDHACEHALQLRHQLGSHTWASPAWQLVGTYYWAYFAVMALGRLLGRAPWYVSKEQAQVLNVLSSTPTQRFNPGPSLLECGPRISSTLRQVRVQRRNTSSGIHELVWREWFRLLQEVCGSEIKANPNAAELRLYVPQLRAAEVLGPTWPSDLRNLVNYSTGLAYGSVRGITPTAVFHAVSSQKSLSPFEAATRLETSVAGCSRALPLAKQLTAASRLLVSFAVVLDAITHSLFQDVIERHDLDRRWFEARRQFVRNKSASFESHQWPVEGAAA